MDEAWAAVDEVMVDTFGQEATWFADDGTLELADPVRVFFQSPDSPLSTGQIEFEAAGPQVLILRQDLVDAGKVNEPAQGSEFEIQRDGETVRYKIKQTMPDEAGMIPAMVYRLDP